MATEEKVSPSKSKTVRQLTMCSGRLRLSLEGQGKIPGQEFLDAADRMIGDLGQHRAEIELRVKAVQFCRSNQAVHRGGTFATAIGADK